MIRGTDPGMKMGVWFRLYIIQMHRNKVICMERYSMVRYLKHPFGNFGF